jgi:stalled ribosome rescue protein Dom34
MSQHYHALVWIDHHEAKVFQFDATDVQHTSLHSSHPHQHLHHKANSGDSGHAALDTAYLRKVAEAIAKSGAVLIVGPGSAKSELAAYIERTSPELAKKIAGVDPADHPTDGELVAFARSYFKADDRMHSQTHR